MADAVNWDDLGTRSAAPAAGGQMSFDWDSVGDRAPATPAPAPAAAQSQDYRSPSMGFDAPPIAPGSGADLSAPAEPPPSPAAAAPTSGRPNYDGWDTFSAPTTAADAAVPFKDDPNKYRFQFLPVAVDQRTHRPELALPGFLAAGIRGAVEGGQEALGERPVNDPAARGDVFSAASLLGAGSSVAGRGIQGALGPLGREPALGRFPGRGPHPGGGPESPIFDQPVPAQVGPTVEDLGLVPRPAEAPATGPALLAPKPAGPASPATGPASLAGAPSPEATPTAPAAEPTVVEVPQADGSMLQVKVETKPAQAEPPPPAATPPPEAAAPASSPSGPPPVMPVGSTVHVLDLASGRFVAATVTGHQDGDILVDTGNGIATPANPGAVIPIQIAPMPPEPRSASTIQREEGIGGVQAMRKAKAERDAYTAATGIPTSGSTRDDLNTVLADPRSNAEVQADLEGGGQAGAAPAPPVFGTGRSDAPVTLQNPGDIAAAAGNVAAPTPGQAGAGNYQMGHVRIGGLHGTIETPMGAERSGTAPDGTPWSVNMPADYGYIKGTVGADGDHVDAYFGPDAHQAPKLTVYVVDQKNPEDQSFDEHKAMIGFPSVEAATLAYMAGFSDGSGPSRMGAINPMTWPQFRAWVKTGATQAPVSYTPPPTPAEQHGANLQAIKTAAGAAGVNFTPEETTEAAVEIASGLTPEQAILKVARRALVDAAAKAQGDQSNVAQPPSQPGPADGRAGGNPGQLGPATEPATGVQQPAGGHGPVQAGGPGSATGKQQPSEQAAPGEPGSVPGGSQGQPGSPGGPASGVHPAPAGAAANGAEAGSPVGGEAGLNPAAIAETFRVAFARDEAFPTIFAARQFVQKMHGVVVKPGTVEAKIVDEAIELGVVLRARDILRDGGSGVGANFDALLHLYQDLQPKLGVRTSDSMERQAYSTPVPLAYAASVLGGVQPEAWVYEPTAGNGSLLIDVQNVRQAFVNEIDPERIAALRIQGFQPTEVNAAQPLGTLPPPMSVDVVLANPPFGVVRGEDGQSVSYDMGIAQRGYVTNEIDHAISLFSLDAMNDAGSAVLILGGINKMARTPEARAAAYRGKAKAEFFLTLYRLYNVVDHFTVAGELYGKQGAAWPIDVIVIRGRGKSARPVPAVAAPRVIETWAGIKEIVNGAAPAEELAAAEGTSVSGVGPSGRPGGKQHPVVAGSDGQGPHGQPVLSSPGAAGGVDAGSGAQPAGGDGGVRPSAGQPGSAGQPDAVQDGPGSGQDVAVGQPGLPGPVPEHGSGGATARPDDAGSSSGAGNPGSDDLGLAGSGHAGAKGRPGPGVTEADETAATTRATINTEKAQTEYVPASRATPVGTLVPTNLSSAISNALENVLARVSNETPGMSMDGFVGTRLKYSPREVQEYFSAEQVDAVALAINQVDAGAGFVVGDQTGVGKGRVVAAMIRYAELQGLVPIFVTEKSGLYADMVRDLTAIGMADMADAILATNNGLKLQLTEDPKGPRLRTAEAAVHEGVVRQVAQTAAHSGKLPGQYRVVMTTYTQMQTLRGARTTRQGLLASLAPNAFLIMDEAHNAGGAAGNKEEKVDKKGKLVLPRSVFFRQTIDQARSVFYSSATWAKRPDVMDLYGAKTSMRYAVKDLKNLAEAISAGGVPMQQIVTAGLAEGGQYIRRERSFEGVTYDIVPIEVDKEAYDQISVVLKGIYDVSEQVKSVVDEIDAQITEAAEHAGGSQAVGAARASSTSFGSVMHNLIGQMLLASKVRGAIDRALEKLAEDKKPVITLANTMGSFIEAFAEEEKVKPGDVLALNFNNLLKRYLTKTLSYTVRKPFGETTERGEVSPSDLPDGGALYREMEQAIAKLDLSNLPASPIDYIRSALARKGYTVGEITGRTEAAEYSSDGSVRYRRRPGKELTANAKNATIRAFNSGEMDALIINQSGATGVSLHASETFRDRRKRSMLILQAENNIDTHMQMLGRVHRTGQVIAPEYEQLVADIPAEKRPAAVLASKMASLNASTTSSRKSVMGDENVPDFLNRYGDQIVDLILDDDPQLDRDLMNPTGERGSEDETSEVKDGLARRVTGRIPLLRLDRQTEVYDLIEGRYKAYIEELDAAGENGLEAKRMDLDARQIQTHVFLEGNPDGSGPFAASANLTQYDIKRLFKPPSPAQIAGSFLRSLGHPDMGEAMVDATVPELAAAIERIGKADTQYATAMQDIEATALAESKRTFKKEGAAEAHREKMMAAKERITAFLGAARPGTTITIANTGGEDAVDALVEGFHINDDLGDLAPSRYTLIAITAEGFRRSIGGSDLFVGTPKEGDPPKFGARFIAPSRMSVADLLEGVAEQGRQMREERWFLTGNLLAAFATIGKGQIVNFTDSDGKLLQGMMMPRSFDAARVLARGGQALRGDLARKFLQQSYGDTPPFVTTSDGRVRLARNTRGAYVLTVPASRERGGVYFLDRSVRQATGPFVASGSNMRVAFAADILPSAMAALAPIMAKREVYWTSSHPEAKAFADSQKGPNPPPGGGAPASRNGGPQSYQSRADSRLPPRGGTISPRALNLLAGTIFDMTGNRVEIDVLRKPGSNGAQGMSIGGSLIQVALESQEQTAWTLHHETVHSLRTFGLIRPGEWSALEGRSEAEHWQQRYNITTRYADVSEAVRKEEAVAEGFADYMSRRTPPPKGIIGAAVNRVTTFFKRTASALTGQGFTRAEDVFERIASGEVGQREAAPTSDRPAVSADRARQAAQMVPEAGRTVADTLGGLAAAGIVDPSIQDDVAETLRRVAAQARLAMPPGAAPTPAAAPAAAPAGALRQIPVIGGAAATLVTHLLDFAGAVNLVADPMTVGSDESMVLAKRAAMAVRAIRHAGNKEIERLGRDYTREQLRRMWEVLDTESVTIQTGNPTTGHGPTAAFPTLSADERQETDEGQRESVIAWRQARSLGMVHGDPLPSYVPRIVVGIDNPDKQTHVVKDYRTLVLATMHLQEAIVWRILIEQIKALGIRTGSKTVHAGSLGPNGLPLEPPPASSGVRNPLDPLTGVRTATAQMRSRRHLTVEETEAAAERLPVRPGKRWFTIPQNAAFWTLRWSHNDENGEPQFKKVPIHIRPDFEGPLRAVLHRNTGAAASVVRGLMDLKSRMMTAIMYGVAHLGVVAFRTVAIRPNVIGAIMEGRVAKEDSVVMDRLIRGGLVPMGRNGVFQDVSGIEREIEDRPGRSWTSQVLAWPVGMVNRAAADAVKRGVDRAGDLVHRRFLWDVISSLQVGVALGIERALLQKGIKPADAVIVATREANLAAGAMPQEAMSQVMAGLMNLALFSRSYRATTFAAVKDMFGLPRDIQALIKANHPGATVPPAITAATRKLASIRLARRFAISVIMLDMGIYYGIGSVVQSVLNVEMLEKRTASEEVAGYWRRLLKFGSEVAGGHHLNPITLPFDALAAISPMSEHEEGKRDRILYGRDPDGTGRYIRMGFGKFAEDLAGYAQKPYQVAHDIVSPFTRLVDGFWHNDAGNNQKIWNPYAHTTMDDLQNIADVARWVVSLGLPTTAIEDLAKLAKGSGRGNEVAQIIGGGIGFSFSHGYPGGETAAAVHAVRTEHEFKVQRALRTVIEDYRAGHIDRAQATLSGLGIMPKQQLRIIQHLTQPGATPRSIMKMLPFATPDQAAQMLRSP